MYAISRSTLSRSNRWRRSTRSIRESKRFIWKVWVYFLVNNSRLATGALTIIEDVNFSSRWPSYDQDPGISEGPPVVSPFTATFAVLDIWNPVTLLTAGQFAGGYRGSSWCGRYVEYGVLGGRRSFPRSLLFYVPYTPTMWNSKIWRQFPDQTYPTVRFIHVISLPGWANITLHGLLLCYCVSNG